MYFDANPFNDIGTDRGGGLEAQKDRRKHMANVGEPGAREHSGHPGRRKYIRKHNEGRKSEGEGKWRSTGIGTEGLRAREGPER